MKIGLHDLDATIDINGNKLIVLGSRPAMGKSALALNIISNIAIKQKEAVLYFNLESSKEQIVSRFIVSNSMVEYNKFRKMKAPNVIGEELTEEDWDRIAYGTELLKTSKIFIEDKANISIDEICLEARKMRVEQKIQFIVIDYLQLIRYEGEKSLSRDLEINRILEKLKLLSEELNIPILVLSQLSREPEKRNDHRPRITDFSNTNEGIYTYSDIILLLYRDEYYNVNTKHKNIAEIIIAKGTEKENIIEVAWMPEYLKFGNLLRVK